MSLLTDRLNALNTAIETLAGGQAVYRLKTADKEITYQQADIAQLRKERDMVAHAINAAAPKIVYWGRDASRD